MNTLNKKKLNAFNKDRLNALINLNQVRKKDIFVLTKKAILEDEKIKHKKTGKVKNKRVPKKKKNRNSLLFLRRRLGKSGLFSMPANMVRVIVTKILTMTPKKPNSALRKVIVGIIKKSGRIIRSYIPGEGDNRLQAHSEVLIRPRNRKDLPGVRFEVIRGAAECAPCPGRQRGRSHVGTKAPSKK